MDWRRQGLGNRAPDRFGRCCSSTLAEARAAVTLRFLITFAAFPVGCRPLGKPAMRTRPSKFIVPKKASVTARAPKPAPVKCSRSKCYGPRHRRQCRMHQRV